MSSSTFTKISAAVAVSTLAACCGLCGFWATTDELASVRIELTGPEQPVLSGSKWTIEPSFINDGWRAASLAAPIDGSDQGWRMVTYEWIVSRAGQRLVPRVGRGCGNTNPWRPSDVFALGPGETKPVPEGFLGAPRDLPMLRPGRYSVRLAYSFDYKPFLDARPLETLWLLAVNQGTIRSEEVVVEILPSLELQILQKKPVEEGEIDLNEYFAVAVRNVSGEPLQFAVPGADRRSSLSVAASGSYFSLDPPTGDAAELTLQPGEVVELPPMFGDRKVELQQASSDLMVTYRAPRAQISTLEATKPIVR